MITDGPRAWDAYCESLPREENLLFHCTKCGHNFISICWELFNDHNEPYWDPEQKCCPTCGCDELEGV